MNSLLPQKRKGYNELAQLAKDVGLMANPEEKRIMERAMLDEVIRAQNSLKHSNPAFFAGEKEDLEPSKSSSGALRVHEMDAFFTNKTQKIENLLQASISGTATDAERKNLIEQRAAILGLAAPVTVAPTLLSDDSKVKKIMELIREGTNAGRKLHDISQPFSHSQETELLFKRAVENLKSLPLAVQGLSQGVSKTDMRIGWKGMLMKADDVKKTQKQKASFGWEFTWIQASFTNVDNPAEKLFIKGAVPFIKQNVVYCLDIAYEHNEKWGDAWMISKGRCRVIPPYHDKKMLTKCLLMCATRNIPEEGNKLAIDNEQKKLKKDMKSFIKHHCDTKEEEVPDDEDPGGMIDPKAWVDWLRDSVWGQRMVDCGLDFEYESQGFIPAMFPQIDRAYFARQLFTDNEWWDRHLPEKAKLTWEQQLNDPHRAFRMCFRQTMHEYLRYTMDAKFVDEMENAPFEKDKKDESLLFLTPAEEEKARKKNAKKRPRDPYCDLMLELNSCDFVEQAERSLTEHPGPAGFVPEMTLSGFKNLCRHHCWAGTEEEVLTSGFGGKVAIFVPQLPSYFIAIEAYRFVKNFLDRDECKECGMLMECVPPLLQPGVELLAKEGVFTLVTSKCDDFHHNRYTDDHCQHSTPETEHKVIFHALWAQCKRGLVQRLKRLYSKHNAIPKDQIPEEDWVKYHKNQRAVVDQVNTQFISTVHGMAGSGKTELIRLLHEIYECVILGFTGRSVDVAASRIKGAEAHTIHSFKMRSDIKQRKLSVLIWDETSQIAGKLAMQALAVIDFDRLVCVGDAMQSQSFGTHKCVFFREFIEIFPGTEQLHNFRMEQDPRNKILPNCQLIREGKTNLKWDRASFLFTPRDIAQQLQELVQAHALTGFDNIIFLTCTNPYVQRINAACVKEFHRGIYSFNFPSFAPGVEGAPKPQTFFTNTFIPQDRVSFTTSVNRNALKDTLDLYWNRIFYCESGQWDKINKKLFFTRNQDKIVKIFRITNSNKLLAYYKKHSRSLEEVADRAELDKIDDICRQRRYKDLFFEEDEVAYEDLTSDVRTLPIPADCMEELSHITRADFQGCEFQSKLSSGAPQKEVKKERFLHDLNIVLVGESGKWWRLTDQMCHGYSSTIFSAQGMEKRVVAYVEFEFSQFIENTFGRTAAYTCVSRAREVFYYLGKDPQNLKIMIGNNKKDICLWKEFFKLENFTDFKAKCKSDS